MSLNVSMANLQRTQFQAALAVSGAWQGSNCDKVYEELGWETLDMRRYFRRLLMFYKIVNRLTPVYLRSPVPRRGRYDFRTDVIPNIPFRSTRYRNSFYPDCIRAWNNIGPDFRKAKSLAIFKNNLLKLIRPRKRDIFNIHDRDGIRWIYQLRIGLSPLRSHKHKHNFISSPSPVCLCTLAEETTTHFLLECITYNANRQVLFTKIDPILFLNDLVNLTNNNKRYILLYGHEELTLDENQTILEATIDFIHQTGRFLIT